MLTCGGHLEWPSQRLWGQEWMACGYLQDDLGSNLTAIVYLVVYWGYIGNNGKEHEK